MASKISREAGSLTTLYSLMACKDFVGLQRVTPPRGVGGTWPCMLLHWPELKQLTNAYVLCTPTTSP
jgi:hypothetical protein